MSRRLVLHAGMFKTGSSSIQSFLAGANLTNATCFSWNDPNHSALFVLLFTRQPETDWIFRQRGLSAEDLSDRRLQASRELTRQIEASRHDMFVFSAERLYRSRRADLTACRDFFDRYFPEIRVHCYVRDPMGYAASMLQQNLKTGNVPRPRALLPKFRQHVGNLDYVFGPDNVMTRLYSDPGRPSRNIVADFCDWTGLDTASDTNVVTNTSMSAEATALLYLFRKFSGFAESSDRAVAANSRMVRALMTLPGQRMALTPDFFGDEAAEIADDQHWMEARMNDRFQTAPRDASETVTFTGFDALEAFGREVFLRQTGRPFDKDEWQGNAAAPERFAASVTGASPWRSALSSLISSLQGGKRG
ncbi:MAG: hypothetical protein RID23_20515 [Roseovarius sp.]